MGAGLAAPASRNVTPFFASRALLGHQADGLDFFRYVSLELPLLQQVTEPVSGRVVIGDASRRKSRRTRGPAGWRRSAG